MNDPPLHLKAIVVVGTVHFDAHQLTDQRIAQSLASMGLKVVYVDPGFRIATGLRRKNSRRGSRPCPHVDSDSYRLSVFVPLVLPYASRRIIGGINAVLGVAQLAVALRKLPRAATGVIIFGAHPFVVRWLRRWISIVVIKDDYVAGAALIGFNRRYAAGLRRRCLNIADSIVCVSIDLQNILLREGFRARVIPPGVYMHPPVHAEPHMLLNISRPRAVFVGLSSSRVDWTMMESVADAGWHIVLIGGRHPKDWDTTRLQRLVDGGLATEVGPQSPEIVSALTEWCDVGLLPYELSDFNRSSSPLKLLEYLGAGLDVMSTDLPAVTDAKGPGVHVAFCREDVAGILELVATRRDDVRNRDQKKAFAQQNTWKDRALKYLGVLDSVRN